MSNLLCAYCALQPAIQDGACATCRPHVGRIIFGATRGADGLVIPQGQFRYDDIIMADAYFSETPRVEHLQLVGQHSNPRPDHAGSVFVEEMVSIAAPSRRLMKRYFTPSTPSANGLFRGRTSFVAGVDFDILAQHGPGRISIRYRRAQVRRVLAEGFFDLLD